MKLAGVVNFVSCMGLDSKTLTFTSCHTFLSLFPSSTSFLLCAVGFLIGFFSPYFEVQSHIIVRADFLKFYFEGSI